MSKVREHRLGLLEYAWVIVASVFFIIISNAGINSYKVRTEMLERTLPMAKNFDVVSSFLDHSPSRGAVSTDGEELKSYNVVIARWDGRDEIVMPGSSVFHSVTTTKHRNLVRAMALSRGITVREID